MIPGAESPPRSQFNTSTSGNAASASLGGLQDAVVGDIAQHRWIIETLQEGGVLVDDDDLLPERVAIQHGGPTNAARCQTSRKISGSSRIDDLRESRNLCRNYPECRGLLVVCLTAYP